MRCAKLLMLLAFMPTLCASPAFGQMIDEITPESERALDRGLAWLARQQGPEGNWESNDLGLVAMGALAFLSAGHAP
ncbi:MAG TPA: squalene--hopene cyclase, partial [Pirellulales bacterium]